MFEPIQFINYLKYMGGGMLGVFIIIGIIIASTYAIGKWTAPAKENDEK